MGTAKKFAAICILCIAGCAREYADEEVSIQLPEGKHPVVRSMELGKSVEARAIRMHVFGERGPVVLFFGGMHGDEPASQHVALCLVDYLLMHEQLYAERRVAVIPTLNPDGIARRKRVNANGVDINRNFPTQDWRQGKRNKFYGGPEAASEPETRALLRAADTLKPLRIVAIHVAVGIPHCVEYDGPAAEVAHAMAAHNGYPLKEEMGYPTPGSFGTWAGKERDIPEITLELPDHQPGQKLWPEHRDALIAAIVFGLDNQQGRQSPMNDYPEAADEGGWGEPVKGLRCRWIGPKGPVFVEDNPEISMEVENVSDKQIFWECLDDCGLAVIEPGSAGRSIRLLRFKVRFKQGARQATATETRQHFQTALPGHYCLEPKARMALTGSYPWPLAKAGPTRIEGHLFRENPQQGRDFPYPEGLILCPPLVVEVVAQDLSHLEDDILQMISLKADQIRQLNKTLPHDRKLAAKFDIPKKDLATTPSDVLCRHFFAVSPLRVWFGMYDDRNMGITRAIRASSTLGTLFGREDIIPAIIKVYQETPLDPEKMQDLDPGTTSMSLMTIDEFLIYPPVFEKVAGYEKQILSVLCERYRKMERVNSSRADDPLYGAIYSSTKNLTLLLLERVRPSLHNSLVREREYSKLFAQVENVAFDPEFKDITTEDTSWMGRISSTGKIERPLVQVKAEEIEKKDSLVWGKEVEGIQVRLRPDKRIWNEGDDPSFKVDMRNNGTRELETCLVASIALDVDGKAYAPRAWFQLGLIRVFPFGPGSEYTIKISLSNFRLKGKGADELTPGKHTIRAVYLDNRDDSGIHTSLDNYGKMALAFSNPVEITIGRVLPGSGLSIDEAIKEKAAFAAVCEAVEKTVPVLSIVVSGGAGTVSQEFKVVEVLFGKAEAVDRVRLNYKYIYKEPECERAIRKHERVIWIGHTRHMIHGSLYGLKALPDTPENRQAVKAAAPQAATVWGEAVNGLRAAVEFVPEKESYSLGERVGVRFHIQNVSDHDIQIASSGWRQEHRIFVQDDEGKEISVRSGWFTGDSGIVRYILKPRETVVLKSSGLGFGDAASKMDINTKPLTSTFIRCGPGRYFVHYKLKLPDMIRKDGDGKVIVPQPDDWQGALETGKRKLVITSTAESDQKSTRLRIQGRGAKSDGKQDAALQKFIRQYSKQKIVCLDIGEQYTFRSHNGIEKLIRLVSVKDYRDTVIRRVRRAEVVVEVNGKTVRLVCKPYTMPTVIDGLRIQADTTSGWGNIARRVQFSIWDANDPIVDTRKFCFPIKRYLLFSHGMQAYNEVLHLGLRDGDPKGHTGYHDYGIDLGGYDGGEEVVSCCSGQVVSLWPRNGMPSAVSVQDQGGLIWLHSHLNSVAANIAEGVWVSAGQKIGVLGKKGHSGNFSHLHLGTSLTRADLTANRFCKRLNLYPWIVTAFQEKYGRNLYAVARPHQVLLTGEKVIFDGSKSLAYDAKIVDYRWEFENGQVVRAVKAGKVFDKPGVYVGTLRIRDEQGNEDVDFCRVKVFERDAPEDNIPATIYMTHTPTLGISEGQEVLFQFWIQGSRKERISIDFGDGATLSDYVSYQEVRHKFDRQGIYIITATANVNGRPIMGKQRVGVESNAGR